MKEQRRERPDYPAEFDQVASGAARRIIRELKLEDTVPNWRQLRDIILDVLVPGDGPPEGLER
jgi:hypothetical protein